jgi:lipoate---protein ligase
MDWTILDSGKASADHLMEKDRQLLFQLEKEERPILHFYEWEKDSATYGHFVDPYQFLDADQVKALSLDLARRPTGGGIIFHIWDFAFSVLVPSSCCAFSQNTLENYAFVNQAVLEAVKEFLQTASPLEIIPDDVRTQEKDCRFFCMAKPTKYDVVLHGKKIAGAAQRKTKHGYLHQGTISMMMPSREYLQRVLRSYESIVESMFAFSFPLMGTRSSQQELKEGRLAIKELLKKYITREI